MKLENKEQERQACGEALERERVRVKQLQEEVDNERLSSHHKQEESAQTLEVYRMHQILRQKTFLAGKLGNMIKTL